MNTLASTALIRRRLALLPAVIALGTVVMASPAVATSTGHGHGGDGSRNSGDGSQKDNNKLGAQGNESQNKTHHNKRSIGHVRLKHSPVIQRGVQQLNSNSGVTAVQAAFCKKTGNCKNVQNYWVGHW
ncbi:hypothetical protein Pth03_81070 [Planotetraspora thailandica]|uniref:Uncharacterized protein n=1 Tax=Planotetraspora thailandica TaxID=487172 RepID=A0A8J3Y2H9_9ACTN|nr:hypothetical protein [Planotetraspora thailandica]GII59718.1 hypothetical protein Pth03_81070 [Planotetraspora thailandica]